MANITDMGLIILAGGKSNRMGKNKAFLELGEQTLIEGIIQKGRLAGIKEIIIVTNEVKQFSFPNVKVVEDYYPGLGPLAGIHAGLTHSKYFNNFILPCDMPFINFEIISILMIELKDCQIAVPKMDGKYQPLVAIYTKECISYINVLLQKNITKIILLYELIKTCYVELNDDLSFFNINTPEDFLKAQDYLSGDNGV